MEKQTWKPYVFWILLTEAVGLLSGWLSREGTAIFSESVVQPPLSPPALLFPFVWAILYALMGISAARISLLPASPLRTGGLRLYIAQLTVNFFWSLFFFQSAGLRICLSVAVAAVGACTADDPGLPETGSDCGKAADPLSALADLCGISEFWGMVLKPVKYTAGRICTQQYTGHLSNILFVL